MDTEPLFDSDWARAAKGAKDSWVSSVFEEVDGTGCFYLQCISAWFHELPGSKKQKKKLKAALKSTNNSDHLGAVNELSWWRYWKSRGYDLRPIPSGKAKTPDFVLILDTASVFFEVTTLNPSKNPKCSEINYSQWSSRNRIVAKAKEEKRGQFIYGQERQCPSVLVLFNYDEWSGLGTEFHRSMESPALFSGALSELSAIIYVERFVFGGKSRFKKSSMKIIDNPAAKFPLAQEIKDLIANADDNDNWIDCDNDSNQV